MTGLFGQVPPLPVLLLTVKVGTAVFTVTVPTPCTLHPAVEVPTTVYVVLTEGETTMLEAVAPVLQE